MKKYTSSIKRLAGVLLGLLLYGAAHGQLPEGYYGLVANTGYVSHSNGTGANAFNMAAGSGYDGISYGPGTDDFIGPNSVAGTQEITGVVAPAFGTVNFNNGSTSAFTITNTAGIGVNTTLAFNNGISYTLRSTRAAGIAGAIHFAAGAGYTPVLTPAAGADTRFTDGYVSKLNPAGFIYPVGNLADLRTITATGTGTFTTAFSATNVNTVYTGALPAGVTAINTNGYWEWSGTAAATVIISIPDESAFTTPANITIVGYNGTAWTDLGGSFTTVTENSSNTAAVAVPANIVAIAVANRPSNLMVKTRAFLQGATSGGVMSTTLNSLGLLPLGQPYTAAPFGAAGTGYAGTESVAAGFFTTHTNIVDWILVELRDNTTPATIVATRAAFLLNDGSIVDLDGVSDVSFSGAVYPTLSAVPAGNYYIAIRHRNHLGIRSTNTVAISATGTLYDFSLAATQANGTNATTAVGGVQCMWAGNVNGDGRIYNSAAPSDVSQVISAVANYPSNTFHTTGYALYKAYDVNDVNLDGYVKNSAAPSDVTIIISNVANYPANTFHTAGYTGCVERLP